MPSYTPPPVPAYSPPPVDYGSPGPQMVEVLEKKCSHCGKVVPNNMGAGDKCPHCGVFFSYETDQTGKVVKRAPIGTYFSYGGIGTLIAVVVSLIVRYMRS
jgi:hypothetical protein